jgi:ABC-2 type transport system permease protein
VNAREQWNALVTLTIREFLRVTRIWVTTIVPPAITMTLYFIIFGNLIGRRIGELGGFDYMQYIAPGLIMMSVITNSYGNVVSSFFAGKMQRHVEEMLVAPMPAYIIVLGYVAGGVVRAMMVATVVTCVALFFTSLSVHNAAITFSFVILTSMVFSLGGLINAIFAKKFDDVAIIPAFVLAPLTYLGGVFYSISLLPDFWANVSRFNPILYMVNAFRYGMLGASDIDIATAYGIILLFFFGLFALCIILMNRGYGIRE